MQNAADRLKPYRAYVEPVILALVIGFLTAIVIT